MNTVKLWMYHLLVSCLPETRCFLFKRLLLRWCGVRIGHNVRIASSARFIGNGRLIIGDDVWIGAGCFISAVNTAEIQIGSHVDIAPKVTLLTGTHEIDLEGAHIAGKGCSQSIKVGDGCWLGACCIVLPGVSLPKKTIVAAGALVRDSVDQEYSLVAGVPAVIKKVYK